MKNTLLILMLFFSLTCISQTTSKKMIASSCHDGEGRCTGSAYCSACKNCSRCAHCSNGGSCGVCSSTVTYETTTKKKTQTKSKSYRSVKLKSNKYYTIDRLLITTQNVNLRSGPSTDYEILQSLSKESLVYFKEKKGEWALVKVMESNKVGYVNLKYLE